MCGIVGIVPRADTSKEELRAILKRMNDAIIHRGPDDFGFYVDSDIALGMRRLSIIDVEGGHQPITSMSGNKTIVFNGELYNYRALRKELEARSYKFKSSSDTEVVLEAFDAWGIKALERFEGMFAVAVWDHSEKSLVIARDFVGQKSIYFAETPIGLIFASEIKALLATNLLSRGLNVNAMSHYMSMRYLPREDTFFKGINKLSAGQYMNVSADSRKSDFYWDRSYRKKVHMDESTMLDELDSIMDEVVSDHLMSDVPLGAFLSGGIDSSLIVAYASKFVGESLRTFSIGVDEASQSELPWAREVAQKYKTNHFETVVEPNLAQLAPTVVHAMEEPADPLAFGNFSVSKVAAENVTVVLGGDGGDEIFAGYDRYKGQQIAEVYSYLPKSIRHTLIRPLLKLVPESFGYNSFATKLRWIDKMADSSGYERYANSAAFLRFPHFEKQSLFTDQIWRQISLERSEDLLREYFEDGKAEAFIDKMLYADLNTRMADHQLPIVDKMSMYHSLEVRSPFLDRRVIEFAAKIPASYQLKKRRLKYIPRKLGERYLSRGLLYRKKQGFGFPLAMWFRSTLKPLIQQVIDESEMVEDGIFNRAFMQKILDEHIQGGIDHNYRLWMLFNLEIFYRHYIKAVPIGDLEGWINKALSSSS